MISPLAQIHPNAKIGSNVTIEAFSVIYEDVEIGDGTHIMPNVTVFNGSRIGKDCRIFPGAVIGAIPQKSETAQRSVNASPFIAAQKINGQHASDLIVC
jgi:UDP-3-O-[3-hydroxymyristoyl] glucosamine N-acyltransferase